MERWGAERVGVFGGVCVHVCVAVGLVLLLSHAYQIAMYVNPTGIIEHAIHGL